MIRTRILKIFSVAILMSLITAFLPAEVCGIRPEVALADYAWEDLRGPGEGSAPSLAFDSARGVLYRGTFSRGL